MATFTTNERLVFRKEEDGAFLFDPDTGSLYCLNGTGVLIYERCREGASYEELLSTLISSCEGVREEEARKDLEAFLKEMKERGFLIEGEE